MPNMQIIFSHGKESGPWGTKIKRLADTAKRLGCSVDSIDYSDTMDPNTRATRLQQVLQSHDLANTVLVGSSMGGYVTLQACKQMSVRAAFILAPAIYMPGYEHQAPTQKITNLTLVHGWNDDVIPVEHSIRFAREQDCTLHLVNDDHRLIDSLDAIDAWFAIELQRLIAT